MHLVDGENHLIIKRRKEIIGIILDFLAPYQQSMGSK